MFPDSGPPIGSLIADRFEIRAIAGSGGAGTVYRALDRLAGGEVALKLLHSASSEHRSRFAREAVLLGELDHPGIVRAVDWGESELGPYLAMEWLEGVDLGRRLAAGPLAYDDALSLAHALALALGAAHDVGVVHRDLKPANVILVDGRLDRPCLVDFGAARSQQPGFTLTQSGALIGTPAYMAPEQARGDRVLVDARTDVFALGCVVWECVTGRRVFAGENPFAVLAAVLEHEPKPLRSVAPEVPEGLERILQTMLAKDRDLRPADGNAVALALELLRTTGRPARGAAAVRREVTLPAAAPLVWALLADTNRWDRLTGAPPTRYARDPRGVTIGEADIAGVPGSWHEVGEWITGRYGWGERRFVTGLFATLDLRFECEELDGGETRVTVQAWAAAAPGAPAAAAEGMASLFGKRLDQYLPALTRLVTDVPADPALAHLEPVLEARKLLAASTDPVLCGPTGAVASGRLDELAASLPEWGRERLVRLVREASDDVVRLLRPRFLSRIWDRGLTETLTLLAEAAARGVLEVRLVLLCPTCRVAAQILDDLGALGHRASCDTCRIGFGLDLARDVEVVFAPAPAIREVSPAVWCAGAPSNRPHVVAQLRVAPGEERWFEPPVGSAPWRVRAGGQTRLILDSGSLAIALEPSAVEVEVGADGRWFVQNRTDRLEVVQVERAEQAEELLTLAEALSEPRLAALLGTGDGILGVTTGVWLAARPEALAERCGRDGDAAVFHAVRHEAEAIRTATAPLGAVVFDDGAGMLVWARSGRVAAEATAILHQHGWCASGPVEGSAVVGRGEDGAVVFGLIPETARAELGGR